MMPALGQSIKKVKRYWRDKGPAATSRAILETVVSPLFRHRKRLVLDIDLTSPREPE